MLIGRPNLFFPSLEKTPVAIVLTYKLSIPRELESIEGVKTHGYYNHGQETIHLKIPKQDQIVLFQQAVVHEYTHHLFASVLKREYISPLNIPVWFQEGVASYVQMEKVGIQVSDISGLEYLVFLDTTQHHLALLESRPSP